MLQASSTNQKKRKEKKKKEEKKKKKKKEAVVSERGQTTLRHRSVKTIVPCTNVHAIRKCG
jgi:hypothetical protein